MFNGNNRGINLYKFHGSLNWYSDGSFRIYENASLSSNNSPKLILGPGSKLQPEDPFLSLFYEFHKAVREAKICVVIGFSYQDEHIKMVFERASRNGLKIIDVNPTRNDLGWFGEYENDNVKHIKGRTKEVFEGNKIMNELRRLRDL